MLAGMLACAACYDRHLVRGGGGWLVAAALAGLLGALFKYYGLMVLVPLAVMTWQWRGWRGCVSGRFLVLAAVLVVPVAVWTGAVFAATPNPARAKPYFLFQMPDLLWRPTLYLRFVDRFLFKDCGPVTAALVVAGVVAALRGRVNARPVYGWTAMGVLFFFGLGPLLRCHDYYELMLLPAAAVWAALGWRALWGRDGRAPPRIGAAVLLAAAVIHSPWLMGGKFELERGYRVLAERLQQVCPPGGRVVVLGPVEGADVIHYARREGWAYADLPPAADAPEALARWRRHGAAFVAVYRNRPFSAEELDAVRALMASLPVREHAAGPWSARGRWCEYTILGLCDWPRQTASLNGINRPRPMRPAPPAP
jgi:hypothetical protein